MKIKESTLRDIIKEELENQLTEETDTEWLQQNVVALLPIVQSLKNDVIRVVQDKYKSPVLAKYVMFVINNMLSQGNTGRLGMQPAHRTMIFKELAGEGERIDYGFDEGDAFEYTSKRGKKSAVKVIDPENEHGRTIAIKIDPNTCAPKKNSQFAAKPASFSDAVGGANKREIDCPDGSGA